MNYGAGTHQTCTPDIKTFLWEARSDQCIVGGMSHSIALHTEGDLPVSHTPSETAEEEVIEVFYNIP